MTRSRSIIFLAIFPLQVGLVACHNGATNSSMQQTTGGKELAAPDSTGSATPEQKQALAYAAKAAGLTERKDFEGAIDNYRLAIKTDPNSRQWKSGLAFTFWQAKRTLDAVPIWKELASGNDQYAINASKMLKKTAK